MERRSPGEWFDFNGSVYVPVSWEGWALVGAGVAVIIGLSAVGVLWTGGQLFH